MGNQWQSRSKTHTSIPAAPVSKSVSWRRPFPEQNTHVQSKSDNKADGQAYQRRPPSNAMSRLDSSLDLPRAMKPIQTKLTVGAPGDKYEQEADRVADQVMSMPDAATQQPVQREVAPEEELQTKPIADSITPLVQREMAPEEEEVQPKLADSIQREEMPEEEEVQTKAIAVSSTDSISLQQKCSECEQESQVQRLPNDSLQVSGNLEGQLSGSEGRGSPLPDEVRSFMEPRFGADFSQVRVHTDGKAIQMNQDLSAQAFTHKQDIYFGAGKTPGKDALTAHELTHVVQQNTVDSSALKTARTLQRQSESQEQETDQTALQCGVKTVQLPSPGSRSNYVVLKSGDHVNKGILFITNVGKCKIFIHGTDGSGSPLDSTSPLQLEPGEYAFQYIPHPDSTMIVGVTSKNCSDYSALSYDPCTGVV